MEVDKKGAGRAKREEEGERERGIKWVLKNEGGRGLG